MQKVTYSRTIAFLFCLFMGAFGFQSFYLGYTGRGIAQMFTLGGLGFWTLSDLFRIGKGTLKPKDGEYID